MRKIISALLLLFLTAFGVQSAEPTYLEVLHDRAQKITVTLNIEQPETANKVTELIANQYQSLGTIHDQSKADLADCKKQITDKTALVERQKQLNDQLNAQLYDLHCTYIGSLHAYLTTEQIEKVKDAMTYGVAPLTYKAYLEMIPTLKPDEQKQLYAWLYEAREHAMSAASSKEKHGWFGKYKGRINNYLSAKGYDSQAERKGWEERLEKK